MIATTFILGFPVSVFACLVVALVTLICAAAGLATWPKGEE